jgi:DNA polymerase-3 subunit epsilon
LRLRTQRHGAAAAFASAPKPGRRTPWREARWCALDLELTGLNPARDVIIAVGAVPIDEGRLLLGRSVYTLVRTSKRSELDAVLLHKLRVVDVADAPSLEDAIDLILESLSGRVPVFHTAAVERSFLGPRFAERGVRLPAAADTEVLGRVLLRERDSVAASRLTLGKLASMLSLPTGPAHNALGDALTTGAAFIALAAKLDALQPQTVGSLVRAEEQLRGARRLG